MRVVSTKELEFEHLRFTQIPAAASHRIAAMRIPKKKKTPICIRAVGFGILLILLSQFQMISTHKRFRFTHFPFVSDSIAIPIIRMCNDSTKISCFDDALHTTSALSCNFSDKNSKQGPVASLRFPSLVKSEFPESKCHIFSTVDPPIKPLFFTDPYFGLGCLTANLLEEQCGQNHREHNALLAILVPSNARFLESLKVKQNPSDPDPNAQGYYIHRHFESRASPYRTLHNASHSTLTEACFKDRRCEAFSSRGELYDAAAVQVSHIAPSGADTLSDLYTKRPISGIPQPVRDNATGFWRLIDTDADGCRVLERTEDLDVSLMARRCLARVDCDLVRWTTTGVELCHALNSSRSLSWGVTLYFRMHPGPSDYVVRTVSSILGELQRCRAAAFDSRAHLYVVDTSADGDHPALDHLAAGALAGVPCATVLRARHYGRLFETALPAHARRPSTAT